MLKQLKLIFTSLLVYLLFPCLSLTGCDLQNADSGLHGRWLSYAGLSYEFTVGKFTKVVPGVETRRGTYVTDGEYLTLHSTGSSSETLTYKLDFPRLTIGDVTFFHDSTRFADDLSGVWFGYYGMTSTAWAVKVLIFSPMEPRKNNPNIMEGTYHIPGMVKGKYSIDSRNVPNEGTLHMVDTHVSGSALSSFIQSRLHVHISVMFDYEALTPPDTLEWWFTAEEARLLFSDAARKASLLGDAPVAQLIMSSMYFFLGAYMENVTYKYVVTKFDEPIYDFDGYLVIGGDTILTLIDGGSIISFINAGSMGSNSFYDSDIHKETCGYVPANGIICCPRVLEN